MARSLVELVGMPGGYGEKPISGRSDLLNAPVEFIVRGLFVYPYRL